MIEKIMTILVNELLNFRNDIHYALTSTNFYYL